MGNLKVMKSFVTFFPAEIFDIKQFCGSGMFITDPGSEFFHPGYRNQGLKDPGSASKNLSIFNPKIVPKLSEI
jgi:hypothetical protein